MLMPSLRCKERDARIPPVPLTAVTRIHLRPVCPQASARAAEDKRKRFVAYTRELRQAVRERAAELAEDGIYVPEPKGMAAQNAKYAPPEPEQTADEPPPQPKAAARPKAKAPAKPAWALTEDEAEDLEDDEAAQLVAFANNLDYDAYIDDLEVRQALNVIRERIDGEKALEAAAQAAEESMSQAGDWRTKFLNEWNDEADETSSQRSKRAPIPTSGLATGEEGGKPDWDSSTNAGDERTKYMASAGSRAMAEELLRDNPDLAKKHSVRSLATVVEKSQTPADQLPPLRIVTVVENPKVSIAQPPARRCPSLSVAVPPSLKHALPARVSSQVQGKPIDPSNLPYLHRNPAV